MIAGLLIAGGIDVEKVSSSGKTALHYAAQEGHEKVARLLLIEEGVNVNAKDYKGATSLHWATATGHKKMVELLIDNGADMELREHHFGRTVLHYAVLNACADIVRLLIEKGADIYAKDSDDKSALELAASREVRDLIKGAIARNRERKLRIAAGAAIGMLSCASVATLGVFFGTSLIQVPTIGLVGIVVTAAIIGAVSGAVIASAYTPSASAAEQAPEVTHAQAV